MIKLFRLFTTTTTTKTEAFLIFLIFSIIYFIILTFTMFEKRNIMFDRKKIYILKKKLCKWE